MPPEQCWLRHSCCRGVHRAEVSPVTKLAYHTTTKDTAPAFRLTENNELVLSAEAIYGPVAGHLSTTLGKMGVFGRADNRDTYQASRCTAAILQAAAKDEYTSIL